MPHQLIESLSYMVKVARPIKHRKSVCGVSLLTRKCDVLSSQEIEKRKYIKWEQVLPANYDIT